MHGTARPGIHPNGQATSRGYIVRSQRKAILRSHDAGREGRGSFAGAVAVGRETYARIKGACTSVVGQSVQDSDVCFFARLYIQVFGSYFLALQFALLLRS